MSAAAGRWQRTGGELEQLLLLLLYDGLGPECLPKRRVRRSRGSSKAGVLSLFSLNVKRRLFFFPAAAYSATVNSGSSGSLGLDWKEL